MQTRKKNANLNPNSINKYKKNKIMATTITTITITNKITNVKMKIKTKVETNTKTNTKTKHIITIYFYDILNRKSRTLQTLNQT